jgi:hypothetical protein
VPRPSNQTPRPAGAPVSAGFSRVRRHQNLVRDRFIERLAIQHDELNYIHPFREDNGRTRRCSGRTPTSALVPGLTWRTGERQDDASRVAAEQGDLDQLRGIFGQLVATRSAPTGSGGAALPVEIARIAFPSCRIVSSTTATLEAELAGVVRV